jgi:DNA-binding NarL/FixJ family response regulator
VKKIRLLVVEDNRLLRDGITQMLNRQEDMTVVASVGNGEHTMRNVASAKPHVLLLDLGLPTQNSLQLVSDLKKEYPALRIIVMDLIPMQEDVVAFVQAGVSGFIMKDATIKDFLQTIRSVAGGARVLPPILTGSLFSQIVEQAVAGPGRSRLKISVRMTKRERQVIQLVADGMTNKEIAQDLHLAPATVKSHIHNILEKLALRSRVQIARYAHTSGDFREATDSVSLIDE